MPSKKPTKSSTARHEPERRRTLIQRITGQAGEVVYDTDAYHKAKAEERVRRGRVGFTRPERAEAVGGRTPGESPLSRGVRGTQVGLSQYEREVHKGKRRPAEDSRKDRRR